MVFYCAKILYFSDNSKYLHKNSNLNAYFCGKLQKWISNTMF